MHKIPYTSDDKVIIGNDKGLTIQHIGTSIVTSPFSLGTSLTPQNILPVPYIATLSFILTSVMLILGSHQILLKGIARADGLYWIDHFPLQHFRSNKEAIVAAASATNNSTRGSTDI